MHKLHPRISIFVITILTLSIILDNNQVENSQIPKSDSNEAPPTWSTSGARSAYPMGAMVPFGDNFNLFDLFNVFRGHKNKLVDENGNLLPFDESSQQTSSLSQATTDQEPFGGVPPATEDTPMNDLFQKLKNKFQQSKDVNNAKLEKKNAQISSSNPVILVPGYGGSRLEAKLDKPSVVRYFCDLKSDWSDIWINVKLLLPYMIDCLVDNLRLEFDYATNTTRNTPGVDIRVRDSTNVSSVEYLSNQLPISGFAYFAPIISKLIDNYGYKRDLNIRGAPYDFRKAPNEMGDYFEQLKLTSEQMFQENNLKPVTYVCHSMGCNNLLYFFHQQTQKWKDKHVKRLISIAAPWGGSLSAVRAAAIGDDLGMPYLFSESKLIQVQRSLPSTIYLFPHPKAFNNVPLIRSNIGVSTTSKFLQAANSSSSKLNPQTSKEDMIERVYKAQDYKQFFYDINHPDGYRMWLNTKDLLGSLEAPGVEVWCLVGRGQKTLGKMEYTGKFPSSPGVELYDDGDGTVNLDSGKYCTKWSAEQKQPVHYKEFNVGHMEILKYNQVIQYIESILISETKQIEV